MYYESEGATSHQANTKIILNGFEIKNPEIFFFM
jgi:hypothetical protein